MMQEEKNRIAGRRAGGGETKHGMRPCGCTAQETEAAEPLASDSAAVSG